MYKNVIYVMPEVTGCYGMRLVNKSGKKEVNDFLRMFDIWGSTGTPKTDSNGDVEYWFEMPFDNDDFSMHDFIYSNVFEEALERLGVKLSNNYDYCYEDVK